MLAVILHCHHSMKTILLFKSLVFLFTITSLAACIALPDIPPDLLGENVQESESTESSGSGGTTGSGTGGEASEPEPVERPLGLVLNEIYYDAPAGDTDGELFVELYGSPPETNIGDYQVRFVNGADGSITETIAMPNDAEINELGYFVIADGRTGALDTTQVEYYDMIDNFDPQNGPDGVQLLDENGTLLDSLVYGTGAVTQSEDGLPLGEGDPAEDVSGTTLSRWPGGLDTDDNAVDFIKTVEPTPGGEVLTVN